MNIEGKLLYGPHTFGDPSWYVRVNTGSPLTAHESVRNTLFSAFDTPDFVKDILDRTQRKKDSLFPARLDFINYGNTQMVYCLRPLNGEPLTVLVKQPLQEYGVVRTEFQNLQRLSQIDPRFVIPTIAYFEDGNNELYVASYVKNARCVYNENGMWGNFNPIPRYHFERFKGEIPDAVLSRMIGILINYYDTQNSWGVSRTQINGDDFILSQDFDPEDPNSVQKSLKLIAARGFLEVSFEEYLDLIRQEFLIGTHYKNSDVRSGKLKINHKSGMGLREKTIERGIEIGLELRAEQTF